MTDREPYSDRRPAASVVVPVYNKAPHLKACFDCLERQTISKSDLEVLLIDDGSTDESLALCEAFAAERPLGARYRASRTPASPRRAMRASGPHVAAISSSSTRTTP